MRAASQREKQEAGKKRVQVRKRVLPLDDVGTGFVISFVLASCISQL